MLKFFTICYSNKPANLCQYGKGFAENFVYTKMPVLGIEALKDQVISVISVIQGAVDAADGGS